MTAHPDDLLWTENGVQCLLARTGNRLEVLVQIGDEPPFVRKIAQSPGDARNEGEYLRVLLHRSGVPPVAPTSTGPSLVLVVEDDPDNLLAYEEMLKLDGFSVASAGTIAEAKALLQRTMPSAVLLDHLLPDGAGGSLCGALRRAAGHALPIVMVTGMNPRDIEIGGVDCPDAVMSKPCRPDLLTALLALLIGRPAEGVDESRSAAQPRSGSADEFPDAT